MTRSALVLKDTLVSLHHQPTPDALLLRRLVGNKLLRSTSDSASSIYPSSFSRLNFSLRLRSPRSPYHSRLYSSSPFHYNTKPFSESRFNTLQPPHWSTLSDKHIDSKQFLIPQKSSFGIWTTVIIVGFISGAILYTVSPGEVGRFDEEELRVDGAQTIAGDQFIAHKHKMTGETLPGRPGTLTPAEEEKLREFWIATLQVFGALDGQEAQEAKDVNGNGSAAPGIGRAGTDKPKKKRFGILRKKNKNGDSDSTASAASSVHIPAEDDKYGQTKEFHDALANISPETLQATFWSMVKHDHPDALLLRFLRARKWDVEKALVMMVSTMRWRSADMKVDTDIMLNGELKALEDAEGTDPTKKKQGNDFLTQMRIGKSFLHGLDKEGRPMCFVRVRMHRQGEQSEESLEKYTVFVIESARMILAPPVDTAVSPSMIILEAY